MSILPVNVTRINDILSMWYLEFTIHINYFRLLPLIEWYTSCRQLSTAVLCIYIDLATSSLLLVSCLHCFDRFHQYYDCVKRYNCIAMSQSLSLLFTTLYIQHWFVTSWPNWTIQTFTHVRFTCYIILPINSIYLWLWVHASVEFNIFAEEFPVLNYFEQNLH